MYQLQETSRPPYHWLNEQSRAFLQRGYLLPGVTPEQRIRDIAQRAANLLPGVPSFEEKFLDYMSRGWFSLASPVWSNFGLSRGLPVSCFNSYVPDSMDGILDAAAEIGMMSKYGGGTSAYFGDLRGRGSPIRDNGESEGAVNFMRLFDTLIDVTKQGATRRGNTAVYLPIDHPDIREFLTIKGDGSPIQNLFPAVTVTDAWMQSMVDGDADKRATWARVLQQRSEIGLPYIFFTDNVNNSKPQVYKDQGKVIRGSNLCVAPETRILTDAGYVPIQDVVGTEVSVWNGEAWSTVTPVITSTTPVELVRVHTSYSRPLDCTPEHKFYVTRGGGEDVLEVRAKDLQPGDSLIPFKLPLIEGSREDPHAYQSGLGENVVSSVPNGDHYITTRVAWLAGLLDSNVTSTDAIGAAHIVTPNRQFLWDVQEMLQTLRVHAPVAPPSRPSGALYGPTHNQLIIFPTDLYFLKGLGLTTRRFKLPESKPQETHAAPNVIECVERTGRESITMCFMEPLRHMGMFNGILTGQCSEVLLPSDERESFVCCLSSMNLLYFDEWGDTDAVQVLTFFLDAVMSEFIEKSERLPHMQRAHRFAKRHRALGLGVLGWHSYLQSNHIPIGSLTAVLQNRVIFRHIHDAAHEASRELARLYGEPEVMEGHGEANTTLMAVAPTTSSSFILGQVSQSIEPLRSNYYVRDLAKSVTTYRNPYLREELLYVGHDDEATWRSILEHDGSVQHLDFLSDEAKSVFATFPEVSQLDLVLQASHRQEFIDQGQSLNLMIHPKTPTRDVNALYLEAWRKGIKTLYYQHSVNAAQEFNRDLLTCSACEA